MIVFISNIFKKININKNYEFGCTYFTNEKCKCAADDSVIGSSWYPSKKGMYMKEKLRCMACDRIWWSF